ncbi:MAG: glycogen debranching protein [Calditrichaeota bacterium]|nr:MAG: glycogen debranching protein [Calditrichota bacterium]
MPVDFDQALQQEWLETNGLGGWASSTVAGAHTRRYHGLLVAATRPPVGRVVMISKLDETLVLENERAELGCNQYPDAIHPKGYTFLQRFERGLFPEFEFRVGEVLLRKTIAAINGENTTLVLYQVLAAPRPFTLELQPFVAARDFHSLTHANPHITTEAQFKQDVLCVTPYAGIPPVYLRVPGAKFVHEPQWYYNFEYRKEQARGLDFREDLFTYGHFAVRMEKGSRLGVILSTDPPTGRQAFTLFNREKRRRQKLWVNLSGTAPLVQTLVLAADQFLVRRENRLRSVIAGYHWFSDWGRDTMIALPGLCLVTGRFTEAKKILQAFAAHVDRGMLPNRFPDGDSPPEYNTVDATLWYFVAIYKYFQYTRDLRFIKNKLLPLLQEILDWHDRGTRYNIHVDQDGLLYAGEPGVQLTWMDAKIGDWVVTPRQGKAVEVNALWYNALRIFAELLQSAGLQNNARHYAGRAQKVKHKFRKAFWYANGGYLYDVIDGEYRDATFRPNQIFALSLPFPLFSGAKARRILQLVEEKLLTPVGLRSLAPESPGYQPVYTGDPYARDAAYHQGTVWGWLLGPYMTALVRLRGQRGRARAKKLLQQLAAHVYKEAGVGTISEIFDAEPPHRPRGCIAQAWSVAEILRVNFEDLADPPQADPTRPPAENQN